MNRKEFFADIINQRNWVDRLDPNIERVEREFIEIANQVEGLNPLQLPYVLRIEVGGRRLEIKKHIDDKDIFMFHFDPIGNEQQGQPLIIPYRPKALINNKYYYLYLLPELNEKGDWVDLGIGLIKREKKHYYTGWSDKHFQMEARRQHHNNSNIYLVQHVYYRDEDYLKAAWKQLDINKEYGRMYELG